MNKNLVILLAVIIVALYLAIGIEGMLNPAKTYTREQAINFTQQELAYRYPNASVEILDVENVSTTAGSDDWSIRAKVTEGKNTICPTLTIVEMEQKFGFVKREQKVTENCSTLGCITDPTCPIAYPEEAILMPLDSRNSANRASINSFFAESNNSIVASATFLGQFTSPENSTYPNVWLVSYSGTNSTLEIVLNRTGGQIIESYIHK